ncbi:MAG: hypothetical protein ABEJ74_08875 [Haloferacaceae archaeon]
MNDASSCGVLVRYGRTAGTPIEEELLSALACAGVDLTSQDRPLIEFVDPDGLAALTWENPALEVRTRIWDYPVQITADQITVYAPDS